MKSKLIVLFFISACFCSESRAQAYIPFPSDSTTWVVSKFCNTPCDPFSDNQPQQVVQNGDTIKNGIGYHKLYSVFTGTGSPTFHCMYREFSKRIYIKYPLGSIFGNDTSEFVLYDFNINVGDTFTIKTPTNTTNPLPNPAKMKLNSITSGTVSYAMGTRKIYNFSSATSTLPSLILSIVWYEGIGANQGLLYNLAFRSWPITVSPPYPYSYNLNCFYKSNSFVPNFSCVITNVMNSKPDVNRIELFPNPYNNIVTFRNNSFEMCKLIELYDELGRKLFKTENHEKEQGFDFGFLNSGIYFFKATFVDGKTINLKLIKE